MITRIVITGAPGTGKTSLLTGLRRWGSVVPEPARILIAEHEAATGEPSLDHRPDLFVDRLLARSIDAFEHPPASDVVFYDRGLPDCITYAHIYGLDEGPARRASAQRRCHVRVFICPPWREIYVTDDLRRATFEQVESFHASLVDEYNALGYELVSIPKTSVEERVAFVASTLGLDPAG